MMKPFLYITAITFLVYSCSTARNFSSTIEDDIYFVPGEKALVVKEVENLTGQEIQVNDTRNSFTDATSKSAGSTTPPASFSQNQKVINTQTGRLENVNINAIKEQAQAKLAENENVNETLYENTGYWIGGYKGNESDLSEIQRIINLYPEGFAYFNSNGQDIAINLSFDPDWNVYTDNGRYWWFPSPSNINLYSSLLFGSYPKYIWTVIWDNPRFDSWAFDAGFNRGFNWGFNVGWGSPGWNLGFGWNSGFYRPGYGGWYGGWYEPWNDPWLYPWNSPWYGYYPGWGYPHWHHPHWNSPNWGGGNHRPDGNRPRPITGLRPTTGGGVVSGLRPHRPTTGSSGTTRPGIIRPNTNSMVRPGNTTRPGNSTTRPSSTVTRPGSAGVIRPNTMTRPGSTVTRPNSTVTRPGNNNNSTYTRPNSTTRPSTTARPVARPSSVTRPTPSRTTNSNSNYTRPSSRTSNSNVKTYTRPQSSYRPTYNNNSSSSRTTGSSRSTYTPQRSSSTGSSYTPSRSSGGNSRPSTPTRPVRR